MTSLHFLIWLAKIFVLVWGAVVCPTIVWRTSMGVICRISNPHVSFGAFRNVSVSSTAWINSLAPQDCTRRRLSCKYFPCCGRRYIICAAGVCTSAIVGVTVLGKLPLWNYLSLPRNLLKFASLCGWARPSVQSERWTVSGCWAQSSWFGLHRQSANWKNWRCCVWLIRFDWKSHNCSCRWNNAWWFRFA